MALFRNRVRCLVLFLAVSWPGETSGILAQERGRTVRDLGRIEHSAYKVDLSTKLAPPDLDHPLIPALQVAHDGLRFIEQNIDDYSCRLVSRSRINGRLRNHDFMFLKLRHQKVVAGNAKLPFAVYIRYQGPSSVVGREVLFVAGQNDNEILARNGGSGNLQDVTMSLLPHSPRAMRNQRYAVTEIGIKTLVERLIDVAHESLEADRERQECEVKIGENAKIDGRACRIIQVKFPTNRPELRFHLARIFVDKQIPIPVRYESYGWPKKPGERPPLREEYTYLDFKTNIGLTDADFDRDNVEYKFSRREPTAKELEKDLKDAKAENSPAGE